MITNLFAYKLLFTVEMLSALYLFTWNQKKRNLPVLRYAISIIVCFTISVFFPIIKDVSYSWWYVSFMFFSLATICSSSLFFIFDMSIKKVLFFAIVAYTAQHLAYQVYTILALVLKLSNSLQSAYNSDDFNSSETAMTILKLVLTLITFTLIYVTIYMAFISKVIHSDLSFKNFHILLITGIVLIFDILVNALVIFFSSELSQIVEIMICCYSISNCFMVLFVLYYVLSNKKLRNELGVSSLLLKESEDKYTLMKNNADLINIKCHDMKHQIMAIGENININKDALKDMTNAIQIYDSNMKTGNEALDLILAEKKLSCNQKKINLKVYADCFKMIFMSDSDIYSLFGNSLDNAIEAVSKISDQEKKNINVIIKNVNSFVSIVVENYYEGELNFDHNGHPKTTKENNGYHGFGFKSMELIIQKYQGTYTIKTNNGLFSLSILFPTNQQDNN